MVFMGINQQCVISDNVHYPHKGDCQISNSNEEYFPKNNDIYLNIISAVSNFCFHRGFQLTGYNCTNIS